LERSNQTFTSKTESRR